METYFVDEVEWEVLRIDTQRRRRVTKAGFSIIYKRRHFLWRRHSQDRDVRVDQTSAPTSRTQMLLFETARILFPECF